MQRRLTLARRNLENILGMITIMRDHIHHQYAHDAGSGQVDRLVWANLKAKRFLDQRLAENAGTQTIRWKFLTGKMYQPDVTLQLAGLCQFQKDRSGLQQR